MNGVNATISTCTTRIRILNLVLKRLLDECTDDPVRHLKLCKCGRSETRFPFCVQCLQDELRKGTCRMS